MTDVSEAPEERQRDYWTGQWDALRLLTTSPRMNRPQIEVIKMRAAMVQEKLEALGVKFTEKVFPEGDDC